MLRLPYEFHCGTEFRIVGLGTWKRGFGTLLGVEFLRFGSRPKLLQELGIS